MNNNDFNMLLQAATRNEPKYIEIACVFVKETNKAVLLNFGLKNKWVPKAVIHDQVGETYQEIETVFLPEWFIEQEKLLEC